MLWLIGLIPGFRQTACNSMRPRRETDLCRGSLQGRVELSSSEFLRCYWRQLVYALTTHLGRNNIANGTKCGSMGVFYLPSGVLLWHRPWCHLIVQCPRMRAQYLSYLDQWESSTLCTIQVVEGEPECSERTVENTVEVPEETCSLEPTTECKNETIR